MTSSPRAEIFDREGFLAVPGLLLPPEIEWYRAVYDRFLSGAIDVAGGAPTSGPAPPRSGPASRTSRR